MRNKNSGRRHPGRLALLPSQVCAGSAAASSQQMPAPPPQTVSEPAPVVESVPMPPAPPIEEIATPAVTQALQHVFFGDKGHNDSGPEGHDGHEVSAVPARPSHGYLIRQPRLVDENFDVRVAEARKCEPFVRVQSVLQL